MTPRPKVRIWSVKRRQDGKWYVVCRGRNGEPVTHGEGYERKASAIRARNDMVGAQHVRGEDEE